MTSSVDLMLLLATAASSVLVVSAQNGCNTIYCNQMDPNACARYFFLNKDNCEICANGWGTYGDTVSGLPMCKPCCAGCSSPCNVQGPGYCDATCNSSYIYNSATHLCDRCDLNCAGGCNTYGKGKCDLTCKTNYALNTTSHNCFPVTNGGWGSWSAWSTCAPGAKTQTRTRSCNTPAPSYGGMQCLTAAGTRALTETGSQACPCDAKCTSVCTTQGAYKCDSTCTAGYGVVKVTSNYTCQPCDPRCSPKVCNQNGAGTCDSTSSCGTGYALDPVSHTCKASVDGNWTSWTTTTSCSVKGDLNQIQSRTCTNPTPAYGGKMCTNSTGQNTSSTEYNTTPCSCDANCIPLGCNSTGYLSCDKDCVPGWGLESGNNTCMASVNGSWGLWSDDTACTVFQQPTYRQVRNCDSPAPAYGGLQCLNTSGQGALVEYQNVPCPADVHCNTSTSQYGYGTCNSSCVSGFGLEPANQTCMPSVDGGWSVWAETTPCTVGVIYEQQTRNCNYPTPMYGGLLCPNSTGGRAMQEVNSTACPCDQNCASSGCTSRGYQRCDSQCTGIYGLNTGNYTCMPKVDGGWGAWFQTSNCTVGAVLSEKRLCNKPTPAYGGNNCTDSQGNMAISETNITACPTTTAAPTTTAKGPATTTRAGSGVTTGPTSAAGPAGPTTTSPAGGPTTTGPAGGPVGTGSTTPPATGTGSTTTISAGGSSTTGPSGPPGGSTTTGPPGLSQLTSPGTQTTTPNPGICSVGCSCSCCSTYGRGTCDGPCNFGYGINNMTHACGPCSSNCASGCAVKGSGKCDSTCNAGYALSSTFVCQTCDLNCNSGCWKPFTCNGTCKAGYVLDVSTSTCLQCDANCAKVVGSCNVKGKGKCDTACSGLYAVNTTTYTCVACSPYCANSCTTEGPGFCDECNGTGCNSCMAGYARRNLTVNGVTKHACYPCAAQCSSGCTKEGDSCCDSSCTLGTWTLKSTNCHYCA